MAHVRSSTPGRGRSISRGTAIAAFSLAFVLLSLPLARFGAWAQELKQSSVAADHAEVISQGVASLSSGDLAWRLVEDTAEPLGEAAFEERALGFAVATDNALLLTDDPTGARTLLASGEAAFTAEGALQARESLEDEATPYLRIGLVDASEARNGNGDEVLFAGNGFASPADDREIELVGVKLDSDESTEVETEFEALVVVIDGQVTVGGGEVLEAGQTTAVDGTVELLAEEGSTRVLVAVIGNETPVGAQVPEIEDESTPIAEETDEASRIVVISTLCPLGVTPEEAQETSGGDPCFGGGAVEGMTVQVINTDTGEEVSAEIDPASAVAGFQDLPAGNYNVNFLTGEGFGDTVGICGGQDQSADLDIIPFAGSSVNLELPADREYLCVTRTIQIPDAVEEEVGTISATFFACPDGMTFDTLDTSQCELLTEGFDFGFQGDVDHPDLHSTSAAFSEGSFFWSGLTLNPDSSSGVSYSPIVFSFPAGYDAYAISANGGDILLPHAGGLSLTEDQPSFSLEVYFFSS